MWPAKPSRIGCLWAVQLNGPIQTHDTRPVTVGLFVSRGRHHPMQLRSLTLCNVFAEKWASCSCWSPSSCATSSSAMSLWSAASSSTCCSSARYLCGWWISSWPARSTSDWATASAVVSGYMATFNLLFISPEDEKGNGIHSKQSQHFKNWYLFAQYTMTQHRRYDFSFYQSQKQNMILSWFDILHRIWHFIWFRGTNAVYQVEENIPADL